MTKKRNNTLLILLIGAGIFLVYYLLSRSKGNAGTATTGSSPIKKAKTWAELKKETAQALKDEGLPARSFPFVWALARFETGDFNSHIFKTYNNAYGMGVAYTRPYVRSGVTSKRYDGNRQLSVYDSQYQGTRDVAKWLKYVRTDWNKIRSTEDFINWLHGGNAKGLVYSATPTERYHAGYKNKFEGFDLWTNQDWKDYGV